MDLGNNYFTVSPMSKRLEKLEPGKTYTGSVIITNPDAAKEDFYYSVSVAPYGVVGADYKADLTTNTNYTMLSKWVTIDQPTGVISPNQFQTINYTITVPDNAPAGGQYAAIVVSKDPHAPNEKDSNVAVKDIHEIASLIYVDIAGETIRKGEIEENNIPAFVARAPITVSAMLSNEGNIHETATIYIKATDVFTGEVLVGLDENEKEEYYTELVMPESTRYIERNIENNLPGLGIVHVEQIIYYNNQVSKEAKDVIICPIWFVAIVAATITLLIFIIIRLIVKHWRKVKSKKMVEL